MDDETAKEFMKELARIRADYDQAQAKTLAEYDAAMVKVESSRRWNTLFSWFGWGR